MQPHAQREAVVRESFNLVSKRPDTVCNFLEGTEVTHSGTKAYGRGYADGEKEMGMAEMGMVQLKSELVAHCS